MYKKVFSKFINVVVNIFAFFISLFIPKSKKIWLFGSWFGKNFSDNSKYLFLYCEENKEKLGLKKVIWVTDNESVFKELKERKLLVFKKRSILGIWYHFRAGYHFVCQYPQDINPFFSVRTKRVQLWHGVGFKNIAFLDKIPNTSSIKYKAAYLAKKLCYPGFWYSFNVLSTSKFATENIFYLTFRLWENNVIESNYPRNIYIKDINEFTEEYYMDKQQLLYKEVIEKVRNTGKKVVLYMPTYRNNAQIDKKTSKVYPLNIHSDREFDNFNNFLVEKNICILSKFHFVGNVSSAHDTDNFINLPVNLDIYPLLGFVDILITDYSSIYADFLFIDKPIIFYPYDLEEYEARDKGFLFDYEEVTPGPKVFNVEELKMQILNCIKFDEYVSERNRIRTMYFNENVDDNFDMLIKKIKAL